MLIWCLAQWALCLEPLFKTFFFFSKQYLAKRVSMSVIFLWCTAKTYTEKCTAQKAVTFLQASPGLEFKRMPLPQWWHSGLMGMS